MYKSASRRTGGGSLWGWNTRRQNEKPLSKAKTPSKTEREKRIEVLEAELERFKAMPLQPPSERLIAKVRALAEKKREQRRQREARKLAEKAAQKTSA